MKVKWFDSIAAVGVTYGDKVKFVFSVECPEFENDSRSSVSLQVPDAVGVVRIIRWVIRCLDNAVTDLHTSTIIWRQKKIQWKYFKLQRWNLLGFGGVAVAGVVVGIY